MGFVTEPDPGGENPLGDDPGRLHDRMFSEKTTTDAEIYATTGAVLIGKRMFEVGVEPWGDPPPALRDARVRLFQGLDAVGIELRETRSIDTPRATHLRSSVLT